MLTRLAFTSMNQKLCPKWRKLLSIAQSLPNVASFFMQECPLCQRENRIVVLGIYRENPDDKQFQKYPDIGYSFCNCKNIFYTRMENLFEENRSELANPVKRMKNQFDLMTSGETRRLILPDPFFCAWENDPYSTFTHWNPRVHHIIWDKDQFEEEMREIGFEIISCHRQFDLNSPYQQTFEIVVRKP
jgi:hypothetical protein